MEYRYFKEFDLTNQSFSIELLPSELNLQEYYYEVRYHNGKLDKAALIIGVAELANYRFDDDGKLHIEEHYKPVDPFNVINHKIRQPPTRYYSVFPQLDAIFDELFINFDKIILTVQNALDVMENVIYSELAQPVNRVRVWKNDVPISEKLVTVNGLIIMQTDWVYDSFDRIIREEIRIINDNNQRYDESQPSLILLKAIENKYSSDTDNLRKDRREFSLGYILEAETSSITTNQEISNYQEEFDPTIRERKTTQYNFSGYIQEWQIDNYSNTGRIIKSDRFYADGTLLYGWKMDYYSDWKLKTELFYNGSKEPQYALEYKYNKFDELCAMEITNYLSFEGAKSVLILIDPETETASHVSPLTWRQFLY